VTTASPMSSHVVQSHAGGATEVDAVGPRRAGFASREIEEARDEPLGAFGRLPDRDAHRPEVRDARIGVRERDVDLGAHDGERRAQLMRGVGDEPALRVERRVEPVEHAVQRAGRVAELVGGAPQPDPLPREGRVVEPLGGLGDAAQRRERPAGEPPAGGDGEHERREPGEHELQLQVGEGGVGLGGRRATAHGPFDEEIGGGEQSRAGDAEQSRVERGEPQADGQPQRETAVGAGATRRRSPHTR
jgi:hypothetical protein